MPTLTLSMQSLRSDARRGLDEGEEDRFLSSWQSRLPDSVALTNLSILGSHNSLAYNRPGKPPVPDISRTQFLDVRGQLEIGVRYLDIRMRHFKNAFVAHHGGTYLHWNFEDVVRDLCWFLDGGGEGEDGERSGAGAGRRETIVVRLKKETGYWDLSPKNSQDWDQTLSDYFFTDRFSTRACLERIWWHPPPPGNTPNEWPTLGDARGKIIILENFLQKAGRVNPTTYGFQWGDKATMSIQDSWRVLGLGERRAKFDAVVAFWRKHINWETGAVRPEATGRLLVNHVSGSGALAWPLDVATGGKGLNRRVESWLEGEGRGLRCLGVVVEDFVARGKNGSVGEVVGRNFKERE